MGSEAPEGADAEDVEVRFLSDTRAQPNVAAACFLVALPFAAEAQVAREVVLQPETEGEVVVVVLVAAEGRILLDLRPIGAQATEDRQPTRHDRPRADRRKVPRGHLGLVGQTESARGELPEIRIAQLGTEIAVELVPAKGSPGRLLVITTKATGAGTPVFGFGLADTGAEIEGALVHLRRRRERECGSGNCENCEG